MVWSPVTGLPIQYSEDASGTAASGNYLKFYASGTTTPINMATDSTGATTLAKCQLNSLGQAINGSSAVFIPHIDQKYKAVLYPDSTTADANTFASAIWNVDGITDQGSAVRQSGEYVKDFDTMSAAIASTTLVVGDVLLIKDRANSHWDVVLSSGVTENGYNIVQCVGVGTLSFVLRTNGIYSFDEFGLVGDGTTDCYAGWKAIVAAVNAAGTGIIVLGHDKTYFIDNYYVNGLMVNGGDGRTVLNFEEINGCAIYGNGSTIKYVGGWTRDSTLSTNSGLQGLSFARSRKIRIYDLKLDGGSSTVTNGGGSVEAADWTGIRLLNCRDVKGDNVEIVNFGRDCITTQQSTVATWQTAGFDRYNTDTVHFTNSRFNYAGRLNYSNIGGRNVLFENCELNYCGANLYGGFSPVAAVDIEPDYFIGHPTVGNVDSYVENIRFVNCELNKGSNGAIAYNLQDHSRQITYENCHMHGATTGSILMTCGAIGLKFLGCHFYLDGGFIYLSFDPSSYNASGDSTFKDCHFYFTDALGVARIYDNNGYHRFTIDDCYLHINNDTTNSYSIELLNCAEGSKFRWNRVEITTATHTGVGANTSAYIRDCEARGNTYVTDHDGSGGTYFINDYGDAGNVVDEDFTENSTLNGYRARAANWPIDRLYCRKNSQIAASQYVYTDNSDRCFTHKATSGIPTSGTVKRGDVFWNEAVTAGGTLCWVVTTAGDIGTTAVLTAVTAS